MAKKDAEYLLEEGENLLAKARQPGLQALESFLKKSEKWFAGYTHFLEKHGSEAKDKSENGFRIQLASVHKDLYTKVLAKSETFSPVPEKPKMSEAEVDQKLKEVLSFFE